MPKTQFGKYSLRLMIAAFLLFILAQFVIASGQRGGNTFFDKLWISIPMLFAGIVAIASFISASISIIKAKERSPLVFICCLIGCLILFFIVGEFVFPH